jgi:hypothetical protein
MLIIVRLSLARTTKKPKARNFDGLPDFFFFFMVISPRK